jgi:hypothetical protein
MNCALMVHQKPYRKHSLADMGCLVEITWL